MDLYARKIIAYKISTRIDTKLATDTLDAAVAARGKSNGIIFHTDRGCQFTSGNFRKHLEVLGMIQSFSKKGHPYDNAVMECFFKYLKKEETDRRTYSTPDELKQSLFVYINSFYNSTRPHSSNGGLSPDMLEVNFFLS
jgi:putative transposase